MITVIVATYNGEHTLPRFLESLVQQSTSESWKLVIVDNASIDSSKQIIESFKRKVPIQYIFHATRGKNSALNRALEYVEGDVSVFTDDDIVVPPTWLLNFRKTIDGLADDVAILGGAIEPLWEIPPKRWQEDSILTPPVYVKSNPEWKEGKTTFNRIWGANMATRSRLFSDGFRFDESRGPSEDKHYIMGSETSFSKAVADAGYLIWYNPRIKVRHIIRPHQMKLSWALARGIRYGRTLYKNKGEAKRIARVFGLPVNLLKNLFKHISFLIISLPTFNSELIVKHLWWIYVCRGKMLEAKNLNTRHDS